MKSHLQRLAASVIDPAPKLHPLLGSIFEPARHSDSFEASEPFTAEDEIVAATGRGSLGGANTPAAGAPLVATDGSASAVRAAGSQTPGAPLIASVQQASAMTSLEPPFVTPNGRESDGPRSAPVSYRPLIPETSPAATSWSGEMAVAPAYDAEGNAGRAPAPFPAASLKTEADEIHIHIGRIEVAASPPPAPRPAGTPPARKSLNLAEYLKRNDGRAR